MQLDQQISELLYHYDCVIIPEFGGFITNYKAAHLDERLHLFHPPSKEVSFNKNLTRNDGLLAQYLTEMRDCSFEEANAIIKKNVEDYFSKLNNGERVVFKKVGIIYRDANKSLRFQPSKEQNFLKDAFGLEQLFAVPAERPQPKPTEAPKASEKKQTAPAPEPEVIQLDPTEQEIEEQDQDRKWVGRLAWASVLVLPIFAYAGWVISTADLSQPDNLTIADLNPFRTHIESVHEARDGQPDAMIDSEDNGPDANWLESDEDVVRVSFTDPPGEGIPVLLNEPAEPAPAVNTYVATPEILAMRYHVVGGCFSELANARGLVDDLRSRGYRAYILDHHKGLYRVTYGNYARRSEALDALRRVKNQEIEAAWLLVQ